MKKVTAIQSLEKSMIFDDGGQKNNENPKSLSKIGFGWNQKKLCQKILCTIFLKN